MGVPHCLLDLSTLFLECLQPPCITHDKYNEQLTGIVSPSIAGQRFAQTCRVPVYCSTSKHHNKSALTWERTACHARILLYVHNASQILVLQLLTSSGIGTEKAATGSVLSRDIARAPTGAKRVKYIIMMVIHFQSKPGSQTQIIESRPGGLDSVSI